MAETDKNKKEQLSTKWRPKTVEEVVGNEAAKQQMEILLERRDAHCVLVTGPSGCGKTTLAKILANELAAGEEKDILTENVAANGGIDNIRAIVKQSEYMPRKATRVIMLEEAHALTGASKSALLIPTEFPKHKKLVWIFATNKPWMLDQELLNRCYKIKVDKPTEKELAQLLLRVCREEGMFRNFEKEERIRVCREIARASEFVPREALQILQSFASGKRDFKDVIKSVRNSESASLDKAALQILMALYSDQKDLKFRREYLVAQATSQDALALLNRLTVVNYAILCDVNGAGPPAAFYYRKELSQMDAYPAPELATVVSCRLADLKERLTQINIDPAHMIIPELIHMQELITTKREEHND